MIGYYESSVQIAGKCPNECQICETFTLCTYCSAGFFLFNANCLSSCPARYLGDNATRTCIACPYDCYTCDSTGSCLSCNATEDNRELSLVTSRCEPISGFFENVNVTGRLLARRWGRYVIQCPNNCALCTSSAVCSYCSPNYYMQPDTFCYTACQPRYFANRPSRTCIKCPYDCYSCKVNGQCLSCSATIDFR